MEKKESKINIIEYLGKICLTDCLLKAKSLALKVHSILNMLTIDQWLSCGFLSTILVIYLLSLEECNVYIV